MEHHDEENQMNIDGESDENSDVESDSELVYGIRLPLRLTNWHDRRGFHAMGERARLLAIFISELIIWLICYGEMMALTTIEDHLYVVRCRNRFEP